MQRMCNATCGVIQPRGSCTFTQRERKRKEYDTIFNFLEYGKYPGGCTKNHKRALRQKGKNYAVDGGLMYRKSQRKGGSEVQLRPISRGVKEKRILHTCHSSKEGKLLYV